MMSAPASRDNLAVSALLVSTDIGASGSALFRRFSLMLPIGPRAVIRLEFPLNRIAKVKILNPAGRPAVGMDLIRAGFYRAPVALNGKSMNSPIKDKAVARRCYAVSRQKIEKLRFDSAAISHCQAPRKMVRFSCQK
jgi:hypothetical protein